MEGYVNSWASWCSMTHHDCWSGCIRVARSHHDATSFYFSCKNGARVVVGHQITQTWIIWLGKENVSPWCWQGEWTLCLAMTTHPPPCWRSTWIIGGKCRANMQGKILACVLVVEKKLVHVQLMSTSIAARVLQLLGLPTLCYQLGVHTNLEVTVLYTQVNVMGLLFVTAMLAINH